MNLCCILGESADGHSDASSYQQHLTPVDYSFTVYEELTSDSLEENRLVVEDLEPSLENALHLNRAYQSMLMELIQQLDILKQVNEDRHKVVLGEMKAVQAKKKKPEKQKKKKVSFSFFGMPYFKDPQYNSAPDNEDTKLIVNAFGLSKNLAVATATRPREF